MRILSGIAAVLLAALLAAGLTGCSGEGRVSMGEDVTPTVTARRIVPPTAGGYMGENRDDMTLPTNIGDRDDGVID